jgi:hypothetical protein
MMRTTMCCSLVPRCWYICAGHRPLRTRNERPCRRPERRGGTVSAPPALARTAHPARAGTRPRPSARPVTQSATPASRRSFERSTRNSGKERPRPRSFPARPPAVRPRPGPRPSRFRSAARFHGTGRACGRTRRSWPLARSPYPGRPRWRRLLDRDRQAAGSNLLASHASSEASSWLAHGYAQRVRRVRPASALPVWEPARQYGTALARAAPAALQMPDLKQTTWLNSVAAPLPGSRWPGDVSRQPPPPAMRQGRRHAKIRTSSCRRPPAPRTSGQVTGP